VDLNGLNMGYIFSNVSVQANKLTKWRAIMSSITYEQFLKEDDKTQVSAFTFYDKEFVKCSKARKALNKTLETNYRAVYRNRLHVKDSNYNWKEDHVDWDGEQFFAVTASGKLLSFTNSEWGGVELAK
jgi:hypothetical protein